MLDAVLASDRATAVAAPLALATLHEQPEPAPAVLGSLLRVAVRPAARNDDASDGPAAALAGLSDTERNTRLLEIVRTEASAVLGRGARSAVDLDELFADLGAFLLRDLMRTTDARVNCLVRGADEAAVLARLRANLEWYRIWDHVDPERLGVVVGDLSEPGLGLDPEEFDSLARSVDAVYHVGAAVNWVQPYATLKAANVRGTEEILRMAARHRTVSVYYVSTLGVYVGKDTGGVPLRTTDPTGPGDVLPTGCTQSKWVSEQIVDLARERGLPVSVYRIDLIAGDSGTGACQTRDFVWLSLEGLLQAGAVPGDIPVRFRLMPVDCSSSAVLHISRRAGSSGGTFHIAGSTDLSLGTMIEELRSAGYRLDDRTWDTWRGLISADPENALVPLLDAFEVMAASPDTFCPPIDDRETAAALEGNGIVCPPATRELFRKHIGFFTEQGYFEPPEDASAR
ncbi:thioester reductase domain-containing protein [Streptomyces sp. NPDC057966]|uniref:thioester reductase domain-containing protein n=1 Tax=Streptomyces sp. NPDC057966 TaxID=3346292 RepID=UPI0036ECCE07